LQLAQNYRHQTSNLQAGGGVGHGRGHHSQGLKAVRRGPAGRGGEEKTVVVMFKSARRRWCAATAEGEGPAGPRSATTEMVIIRMNGRETMNTQRL